MRNLHLKENLVPFYPERIFNSIADEARIVAEFYNYKKEGYAIDIGAADGISINNCFTLFNTPYEWKGLSIEPNPVFHTQLTYLFKGTDVQVCTSAIHPTEKEVEFIQVVEAGSAMGHSNITGRDTHMEHVKIKVPAKPINEILTEFNVPEIIDFISMDIEGSELHVLSCWDFDKYKVGLWCIENGELYENLLHAHGYRRLATKYATDHGNVFFYSSNLFN